MQTPATPLDLSLDPLIADFREALNARFGTDLKEFWLFGSRARGTSRPDSDYDVLVVADGAPSDLRWALAEETFAMTERYETPVEALVYSPELWQRLKGFPLGKNVLAEGIRLQ
jgi:uncharacterized protein